MNKYIVFHLKEGFQYRLRMKLQTRNTYHRSENRQLLLAMWSHIFLISLFTVIIVLHNKLKQLDIQTYITGCIKDRKDIDSMEKSGQRLKFVLFHIRLVLLRGEGVGISPRSPIMRLCYSNRFTQQRTLLIIYIFFLIIYDKTKYKHILNFGQQIRYRGSSVKNSCYIRGWLILQFLFLLL